MSILYPDQKEERKKIFVRIPLATKVKGEILQQRLKFQTLQQEKISIFPKGYHCYCWNSRFGYWHLGSIWEGKQNKHWAPLAFPIGSPKCGWYRGPVPLVPWEAGAGRAGAGFGRSRPWSAGARGADRGHWEAVVWVPSDPRVQQLPPLPSREKGRKRLRPSCAAHSQTGFA